MEYVQGSNLSDILDEEQRLDTARAVNLTIQICEGLAAAHSKGIVHCDLKPNNILILKSGSKEEVKLVDFGLVQLMPRDSAAPSQMTEKYVICGSPRYMPPEQCAGKAIDERSDIYALGCVLFECLTGESVFDGDTAMEIFAKQLQTKAPLLSEVYPAASFSIDIETLVAKMLSKDPRARPQSMNEVKSSLEKLVDVHSTPQR
jgi:serine/threonine-protein kinase